MVESPGLAHDIVRCALSFSINSQIILRKFIFGELSMYISYIITTLVFLLTKCPQVLKLFDDCPVKYYV